MRAIIRWTIWLRRWSVIWWCLGVAGFIALNLSFYPTFRSQAVQLNQFLSHLPATTRALFSDSNNFLTPAGFLTARLFYLLLPLILSILAIGLGSSLLAREENEGTVELLLARPISRGRLLGAKALAALLIMIIVGGVALGTIVLLSWLVKIEISLKVIAAASGLAILLATLFGAIAFWVTTLGRSARLASVGLAAFVGLGSYIIASLSTNVDWLKLPAHFLPYYYYRPSEVLAGTYNWWYALGFAGVIIVLYIWAWAAFRRRDI